MFKVFRNAAVSLMSAALLVTAMPLTALANAYNLVKTENLVFSKNYNITCANVGDYYHYIINLPTSGKLDFVLSKTYTNNDDRKGYAWCKDANGDLLFEDFGWESGSKTHSYDLLAGKYDFYLSADGTYHGKNIQYSFCVDFTASGETNSESQLDRNDQITMATSYKSGTITGQLGYNDEVDIYKVKIAKSGYTTVKYTPEFGKSYITLENVGGSVSYSQNDITYGKNVYKYFTPAGTYYFTVTRGNTKNTGNYSFSISNSALKSVKIKSLKKYKKGKKRGFKVTYAKNSSCDGYQICYSLKKGCKSGNKYKTVTSKSTTSKTVKGLKKNKKYYVRVRAYKEFNGKKYYSAWSSIKTVTVK